MVRDTDEKSGPLPAILQSRSKAIEELPLQEARKLIGWYLSVVLFGIISFRYRIRIRVARGKN